MEQTLPRKKVYKIIVVGDSGVGKTCLTYRFCEGKFCENTEATIAVDFRTRNLDINGELITLQIWDTAGMERFRQSMVKHYYRNVHAILLVYDMTNQKSFDSLKNLIVECNDNTYSDALRIMVGNKCDKDTVVVERTLAQKFADANNMPLFETSAKLDSEFNNVEAIFMTLAHKLINHKSMILTPTITLKSISSSDNTPSGGGCWPCS